MAAPLIVNGVRMNLLVATAAGASSLTLAAAHSLGLSARDTGEYRFLDASGYASHNYFYLRSVELGTLPGKDISLVSTPDPNFGRRPHLDGVLAADLMGLYDVEIDFASRRMTYFLPGQCPGRQRAIVSELERSAPPPAYGGIVPIRLVSHAEDEKRGYNPGRDSAEGTMVIQSMFPAYIPANTDMIGGDIRTTILLDGKPFTANIDTGQEVSSLNTVAARAVYGITPESPGSMPVVSPPDAGAESGVSETVIVHGTKLFLHSFHSLAFGEVTVNNPLFLVQPDITGVRDRDNNLQLNSLIRRDDDFPRPDVTIGMDVLRHLHLYFAFAERKLYVTSAAS
jgi:hypothetical protein